ncbi:hypothetical protein Pcinc_001955 [Petrolisthes cinctipes]|uniref:Reverse transcriptase RNase H-like domain-containing protein n=1 Tax=Petrolisthes cinctipes TaxID=88211 RepID=A0AAE1L2R1_PETCI|nr:hypothetical protein Pcinc_008167 [Petrolisthes cinctipes]KAK3894291.1 hypothetical protein Pcinc_001955 [Petrolisthes cinctipes]
MLGVVRFDFYLRGKEFILEVDHKPLVYLNMFRGKNDRLMRWSLSLQAYKYRVVHIAVDSCLGGCVKARTSCWPLAGSPPLLADLSDGSTLWNESLKPVRRTTGVYYRRDWQTPGRTQPDFLLAITSSSPLLLFS